MIHAAPTSCAIEGAHRPATAISALEEVCLGMHGVLPLSDHLPEKRRTQQGSNPGSNLFGSNEGQRFGYRRQWRGEGLILRRLVPQCGTT